MKQDKEDTRQKIEEQTKEFLKKGGKVDYVKGSERNASYNITFKLGVKNVPIYSRTVSPQSNYLKKKWAKAKDALEKARNKKLSDD